MANLKQGMSGSEVKDLQKKLISAGYGDYLGNGKDDGIFGAKTAAAVKQYQKDNGLAVDGIAGKNTLGALNSAVAKTNNTAGSQNTNTSASKTNTGNASAGNTNTGKAQETFSTPAGNTYESFTYDDFTYDPFQGSETLNQAWATIGQMQGNKPGEWVDPYAEQRKGYLDQYENRDPFSYDPNSDALYQYYRDMYVQQGQLAMMDAMGQAATMTGGYANSYAQTAGQQAYNQYLGQLNAVLPELAQQAEARYDKEGQELLSMYDLYAGLSNESYNQHQNNWDNYYRELDAATNYAATLYDKEYGEWNDKTKMDFDTWSANTGLSYDEWAAKTGILSGENTTLMNQKFQSEEAQKDRDFQESENNKSRAASRSTGGGTPVTKYATFDYDTQKKWEKSFAGAKTPGELDKISDDMEAAGIDPAIVASWNNYYMELLFQNNGNETDKTGKGSAAKEHLGVSYYSVK